MAKQQSGDAPIVGAFKVFRAVRDQQDPEQAAYKSISLNVGRVSGYSLAQWLGEQLKVPQCTGQPCNKGPLIVDGATVMTKASINKKTGKPIAPRPVMRWEHAGCIVAAVEAAAKAGHIAAHPSMGGLRVCLPGETQAREPSALDRLAMQEAVARLK